MHNSWTRTLILALGLLAATASDALAAARHGCRRCGAVCSAPCTTQAPCNTCGSCESAPCEAAAPAMVEKTIMVPTTELVTRKIHVTEYTTETRERTVTVNKRVPKTETVTCNYTVMVPKTETKTVTYNVCKPVVTEMEQEYSVCVPHTETRNATRTVCKRVPVTKKRTVTVDEGHWEDAPAKECAPAGDCCQQVSCDSGCGRRRCRRACASPCEVSDSCGPGRVWVPNLVQKEISYTCYTTVKEEQPYSFKVTVYKRENRTRTVKKCSYVNEKKTREVSYTRCVPEQRTKSREVTRYECVPTEKTVTYKVCVPHQVEKEVQVRVCKLVPKTVMVPACSDDSCGSGDCGVGRRCRRCR